MGKLLWPLKFVDRDISNEGAGEQPGAFSRGGGDAAGASGCAPVGSGGADFGRPGTSAVSGLPAPVLPRWLWREGEGSCSTRPSPGRAWHPVLYGGDSKSLCPGRCPRSGRGLTWLWGSVPGARLVWVLFLWAWPTQGKETAPLVSALALESHFKTNHPNLRAFLQLINQLRLNSLYRRSRLDRASAAALARGRCALPSRVV